MGLGGNWEPWDPPLLYPHHWVGMETPPPKTPPPKPHPPPPEKSLEIPPPPINPNALGPGRLKLGGGCWGPMDSMGFLWGWGGLLWVGGGCNFQGGGHRILCPPHPKIGEIWVLEGSFFWGKPPPPPAPIDPNALGPGRFIFGSGGGTGSTGTPPLPYPHHWVSMETPPQKKPPQNPIPPPLKGLETPPPPPQLIPMLWVLEG